MTSFETESWLWFGVVMTIVVLRFISRILHFKSFLRFQLEDYLMIFLTCVYITFIVLINISAHTNTNLIDPNDVPNLTPADISERIFGSKVILGVEQTMCMIQWCSKICLLLLYSRLTENLVQNLFVKAVGIYVIVSWIVMSCLYWFYFCRPISAYWELPVRNIQCSTALHHLIVNLAFNLSSDLLVMSIPLPLLLRAHLEIKRKILLCLPFTLGFFSMICAIVSKYASFTHPFSPVWSYWYTREASCVMIVVNMPYIWGLVRRVFKAKSFWGRGSSESQLESDPIEETRDTRMSIVEGETSVIGGFDAEAGNATGEKASEFDSKWKGLSKAFANGNGPGKSTPEIVVEVKEHSEKSSPTGTQSDESMTDEHWKNINWTKAATEDEITPVRTAQSSLSPDSLMPPSPAILPPGGRRTSTIDHRRASTTEHRRLSTFSSRRSRQSVSEASRRSTRTSVNIDAVDRLYRLEDEDLEADLEAARPRSHCSHHSGFN